MAAQGFAIVLDTDGRVGDNEAVDVREAEEPANRVHHRVDRGGHQPALAEVRDVELDVCPLDADQRFEGTCLTPGEPTAQLAGVQRVGVSGVPRQVRHGSELGRRHRVGLERKKRCSGHQTASGDEVQPRHGAACTQ